jgi:hypothetical protein
MEGGPWEWWCESRRIGLTDLKRNDSVRGCNRQVKSEDGISWVITHREDDIAEESGRGAYNVGENYSKSWYS